MKKNLLLLMLLCPILLGAQSFEPEPIMRLTGVVVDEENKPIANASIAKLNSLKETETDENGTFTIDASPGDILRCSALFKETEEVTITGNPIIEVVLKPDMGLLEEVLLIKKKEEEVKNTAFGKKRGVSLGYEANNVASQFISPIDVDMTTVIRKIPGIDFSGNGLDFSFSLRKNKGINPTPVLVVLDGVPVDQNIVNFIDPSTIASLTILRSLAATVRYGTLGVGGVMLIETKMAASLKEEPEPQPVKLSEQERNYKDELKLAQAYFSETTPDYLHTLSKAQNFEEARKIYTRLSKEPRSNTLYFLMDCSDYFRKWDLFYSYKILSEVYYRADSNPKILKSLAFQLEQNKMLKHAKYVYERLIEIQPGDAQSYRDLALIYSKTGELKTAKALYIQMINNSIPKVDFTEIKPTIITEFKHFLLMNKRKIKVDDIPNDFLVASTIPKTRLVLEWTDPMSDFEVQFVGPEKNNFSWNHSVYSDSEFLKNEIEDGFSLREFEIDKAPNGEWLVNIKNKKTDDTAGRTYLRYTFYKNYGFPSEKKKSVLIPLDKIDEKIILDTFLN